MGIKELVEIINSCDGSINSQEYAKALLVKIKAVQQAYPNALHQFQKSKEQGDFRGRVLEINFLNQFLLYGVKLKYPDKQDRSGDIDFSWNLLNHKLFIECKLLREANNVNPNETSDIVRLQRDILAKASTKKFNPFPLKNWINLICVDVSELNFGLFDQHDCILTVNGNSALPLQSFEMASRREILGIFEDFSKISLDHNLKDNKKKEVHKTQDAEHHQSTYIHGVLFLFREPSEKSALSYELRCFLVWNDNLIHKNIAKEISSEIYRAIPKK
jgi:hypothetical protein